MLKEKKFVMLVIRFSLSLQDTTLYNVTKVKKFEFS